MSAERMEDALIEARYALVALAEAASYVLVEYDLDPGLGDWPLGRDVERLRSRLTDPRVQSAVRAASPLGGK